MDVFTAEHELVGRQLSGVPHLPDHVPRDKGFGERGRAAALLPAANRGPGVTISLRGDASGATAHRGCLALRSLFRRHEARGTCMHYLNPIHKTYCLHQMRHPTRMVCSYSLKLVQKNEFSTVSQRG